MSNYISHHNEMQKSYKEVFAFILQQGKTTRREIQKATQYSWSSVSSIVSSLIGKNLVYEKDFPQDGVGRKAVWIIPNGEHYVSIGVDMNSIGFSLSIVGIDGVEKYAESFPFEGTSAKYVRSLLFQCLDKGVDWAKENNLEIISIGISCQGHVEDGSVLEKFPFAEGFDNVNLRKEAERRYGIFTFVEHDTVCIMEDYCHSYPNHSSSVCVVRVVSGIGFSISLKGHPQDLGPLDFGHMIVQPKDGERCSCGLHGCLEAYSSTVGIAKRAGVENFSTIDANRERYRNVLNDAAYYLGITAANLLRTFALTSIVFTGQAIGNDIAFFERIVETYEHNVGPQHAEVSYIEGLSPAYGAARLSFLEKNRKEEHFHAV